MAQWLQIVQEGKNATFSYVTVYEQLTVVSGSIAGTASWADSASYALTASHAPNYLPLTGGTVSGSVTVSGSFYLNPLPQSESLNRVVVHNPVDGKLYYKTGSEAQASISYYRIYNLMGA